MIDDEQGMGAPSGPGCSGFAPSHSVSRPFGEHPSRVVMAFTGTQNGLAEEQYAALKRIMTRFRDVGIKWFRNGDCVGADEEAAYAWADMGGCIHLHPGDNPRKRAGVAAQCAEPPAPNLARNRTMVDGSHALIACPGGFSEELRSGTWATIRYARKHRRPVTIIWPNGHSAHENYPAIGTSAGTAETPRAAQGDSPQARAGGIAHLLSEQSS